jgi:hypothetical protein
MMIAFPIACFAVVATVVISSVFSGHFLEAGRYDKAYEQRHREQVTPIRVLVPGRDL